jgi:hypothetical protein
VKPTLGRIVLVMFTFNGRRVTSPAVVTRVVNVDEHGGTLYAVDVVAFLSSEQWVGHFTSFRPIIGLKLVRPAQAGMPADQDSWFWPERS